MSADGKWTVCAACGAPMAYLDAEEIGGDLVCADCADYERWRIQEAAERARDAGAVEGQA